PALLGQTSGILMFPGEAFQEGASGAKLWVSGASRHGELPGLEGQGAEARAGEHTSLVPVTSGPSLQQQHLDLTVLETGAVDRKAGLLVPVKSVFTPPVVQASERIGSEGLAPEAAQLRFEQVPVKQV